MAGTVGVPMPTIEARLEFVPEMGYDTLSSQPRGEICLRGNTLFSGYHKRQDLTEELMVDGWFHIVLCYLIHSNFSFMFVSYVLPHGGEELKDDEGNRIFSFKTSLGHDDPDVTDMHRGICVMC
ncbi:hypothetical protein RYX36_035571 [Vicia faba]